MRRKGYAPPLLTGSTGAKRANMSEMKNQAVLKCTRCGKPVILSKLATAEPDPELKLLHQLMKDIAKNILCPECQAQFNYNIEQQRKGVKTDYHVRK